MPPLRKCRIRQLLNTVVTTDETDQIQPSSIKTIKNVLKNLKEIDDECNDEERIKHVDETFMDANIYNIATHVAYKCIQKVNYTQHTFNSEEFVDKLTSFLSNGQPDEYSIDHLDVIGEHVMLDKFMPCLTSFSSIYGGLTCRPEPPPKVRKQKETNSQKAVKKHLIKVVDLENENDKKSEDILRFYMKALNDEYKKNDNMPVDYYKFVIDTEDFGLTVENIFYTSFILNDGKIKLTLDDEIPTLLPLDKKSRLNITQMDSMKKNQVVTSISMDIWQTQSAIVKEGILQRHRKNGAYPSK